MSFSTLIEILLRLYNSYVKENLRKLMFALILSFGVAGGTAAIAWLLDPAVKKIFIEQDKTMMIYIPFAIVLAFSIKGLSLYFARTILIKIGNASRIIWTELFCMNLFSLSDHNSTRESDLGIVLAHG